MIYQKYFKYKYLSFFTVINCDENQEDIVVLIPGFTQNGCDIDYFMKELSLNLTLKVMLLLFLNQLDMEIVMVTYLIGIKVIL